MNLHISSSAQLSNKDFFVLQKNAIDRYSSAVWNLSDLIRIGKDRFGRKNLIEMSVLPSTKVDWLLAIASLKQRTSALPEVHYETVNVKDGKKWLKKATKENLKSTELRKQIRTSQSLYKKPKKMPVAASWPKYLLNAELELKKFVGDKDVVLKQLRPLIEIYNHLSS